MNLLSVFTTRSLILYRGMSALSLYTPEGEMVPFSCHIGWTIASIVFAVLGCSVALFFMNGEKFLPCLHALFRIVTISCPPSMKQLSALRNLLHPKCNQVESEHTAKVTAMQQSDIHSEASAALTVESSFHGSHFPSTTVVNNTSPTTSKPSKNRVSLNIPLILVSALAIDTGVMTMHYTGMHAMIGRMMMHYNPWIITLSAVVGYVAAFAALLIVCIVHNIYFQIFSAAVMGLAVSLVHYIGMFSCTYTHIDEMSSASSSLTMETVTIVTIFASAGACFVSLLIIVMSMERERVKTQKLVERMSIYNTFLPAHLREAITNPNNKKKKKKDSIQERHLEEIESDDEDDVKLEEASVSSSSRSLRSTSTASSKRFSKLRSRQPNNKSQSLNQAHTAIGTHAAKSTIMVIRLKPIRMDADYFEYHGHLVSVVERAVSLSKGIMRKFSEAEFIIEFNTVTRCSHHRSKCLHAQNAIVKHLSSQRIPFCIGISTGTVHVGAVGNSTSRSEVGYGDAFTRATILSQIGFLYSKKVLLTNHTYSSHEKQIYVCSPIDVATFPTTTEPVHECTIYEYIREREVQNDEWLYEQRKKSEIEEYDHYTTLFDMLPELEEEEAKKHVEIFRKQYPDTKLMPVLETIVKQSSSQHGSCQKLGLLLPYQSSLRVDVTLEANYMHSNDNMVDDGATTER